MTVLKEIFARLPWTRLRPSPELLTVQPGNVNPEEWQAVAATPSRDCIVAYLPRGGRIELDPRQLPRQARAEQVDPVSGSTTELSPEPHRGVWTLPSGPENDLLLIIRS